MPFLSPSSEPKPLLKAVRHALAAMVLSCASLAQAGPIPWPDAPYSYFANNAKLEAVLAEFAGSFSLSLSMAPGVSGLVNGKFTTKNPTEFVSKLAGVYGFVWYTHAGTLFVSRASELTTRSIAGTSGNIGNLRKALTDLGVLDSRFGWGELTERGVALVSGPPSYVDLVESTVRGLPAAPAGAQQVAVFRLKHASADDRTILYRDKEITTPGLASILRDLITGRGGVGVGGINNESISAIAAPLRSTPTVSTDVSGTLASAATGPQGQGVTNRQTQNDSGDMGSSRAGGVRSRAPSIQSDPRLNALIIQDVPERMPIYEKLIAQLDVPTALIEIEAMILDVNTERAKELGISWAGRDGRNAAGFGVLSAAPASGTLSLVRGPAGAAVSASTLAVDTGNYLINQIRILETNGDARIQSRPSVLTTDNTGALLDLSETFYIRLQGERVASVTPVTAGTTLRVTPRVITTSAGSSIQLIVDIEDGQIQDRQIDTLPTVRRSAVSTQAIVSPNEALLIAGYSTDQSIDSIQRVPVLGDIPVLGLLFSNKSKSTQKRERLFMIKPKIISLPGQVPVAQLESPSMAAASATAAAMASPLTNSTVIALPMPIPASATSPAK